MGGGGGSMWKKEEGMMGAETPSPRTQEADETVHHANKDSVSKLKGVARRPSACRTVLDKDDDDVNQVPFRS